jgi:hypothetical protein
MPSFREMLAGRATQDGVFECASLFATENAAVAADGSSVSADSSFASSSVSCNYNCGARPHGFMRPRRYELSYNATDGSGSVLLLPFVGNDGWNRDFLCNKRGVKGAAVETLRVAARTGDTEYFNALLADQADLRLELDWQIIGAGEDTTQVLALRVNGAAPSAFAVAAVDPSSVAENEVPNPLREKAGSTEMGKGLTKTVYIVRGFCDGGGRLGADADKTPMTSNYCRYIPEVELLGGHDLIPMACAHGMWTKMCRRPHPTKADADAVPIGILAPTTGGAPDEAVARMVMDKDGVRLVMRTQNRKVTSMKSMTKGVDLVDVLWEPTGDVQTRYLNEGGRLQLNGRGNLQLTIGTDTTPTAVWGETLPKSEDVTPWCEQVDRVKQEQVSDIGEGEVSQVTDILRCVKYENNARPGWTKEDHLVAVRQPEEFSASRAFVTASADECVPGGQDALAAHSKGPDGRATMAAPTAAAVQTPVTGSGPVPAIPEERGSHVGASQCIIVPPTHAVPCTTMRRAGLSRSTLAGAVGFVDPQGAMSASLCTERAKRWSRVCGWLLPLVRPTDATALGTQAQTHLTGTTFTQAVFVGPPGGIHTASQSVMDAHSARNSEFAAGMSASRVGVETKMEAQQAGPAGGELRVVQQVIRFDDPRDDTLEPRTADMLLLRHGDAITNYQDELVVLNANARPVITVLDTALDTVLDAVGIAGAGESVRRPLVVGGTLFDQRSFDSQLILAPPQTYTISVSHTGLLLTAGGLDEQDTARAPKGCTRMFVQRRMLEAKEHRELWKSIAVALLPIPLHHPAGPAKDDDNMGNGNGNGNSDSNSDIDIDIDIDITGGPMSEFDVVSHDKSALPGLSGLMTEVAQYWSSSVADEDQVFSRIPIPTDSSASTTTGSSSSSASSTITSTTATTTASSSSSSSSSSSFFSPLLSFFSFPLPATTTTANMNIGVAGGATWEDRAAVGFAIGADGSYSVLQSDIAHSPDFMDSATGVACATSVGVYVTALQKKQSDLWKQGIAATSVFLAIVLLLVSARIATWKVPAAVPAGVVAAVPPPPPPPPLPPPPATASVSASVSTSAPANE